MANPYLATFTITPSTGAITLADGILAGGKTIAITVNTSATEQALSSPWTFDSGDTYRLTLKRPGRYTSDPLIYVDLTRVSDTQATGSLDLTGTEFYILLGTAKTVKIGISLDHTTYGLAAVSAEFTLHNTFRRLADTSPAAPASENTYTDAQVDALDDSHQTAAEATAAAALTAAKAVAITVAAFPTGGSIVANRIYYLSAADAAAKAPPGYYSHDGTAWLCLGCTAAYAWGNLGATPTLALISGALYTWTVSAEVTACTLTLTRPGIPAAYVSANVAGNAFLAANITATGRSLKTVGWDTAIADTGGCTGTVLDDGTSVWLTAGAAD